MLKHVIRMAIGLVLFAVIYTVLFAINSIPGSGLILVLITTLVVAYMAGLATLGWYEDSKEKKNLKS